MNTRSILFFALLLLNYMGHSQNISGIINNYAAVSAMSGAAITASPATAFSPGDRVLLVQMKGATISQTNDSTFGNIVSMGGAGTFEFLNVQSVAGNVITVASAPAHTYNVTSGATQLVRVPRLCTPVVTGTLTCASWTNTTKTGGILALEAETLTLNADIDVSEKGFKGGNLSAGTYDCHNWHYAGVAGIAGGQKGESISEYVTGLNGLRGKQANGGGASNAGNSGGGGGGNAGAGGIGGNLYNNCDTIYDDRGVAGASLTAGFSALFMGGGGGGGFKDNGLTATNGGNGGGIIYIRANAIVANGHAISANGGNITIVSDAEGAGGGGAGGTIFIECNNITGSLNVSTNGGTGGSSNNSMFVSDCHGTGGGGGGGAFAYSQSSLPFNVNYSSVGGAAGTINNPSSSCYGTTYGAAAGSNGIALGGLPTSAVVLTAATLSLTQSSTVICRGETASLTASGTTYYYWSTGSASSVIAVSPTVTTAYAVTGTDGNTSSCQASANATLTVVVCQGLKALQADDDIRIYPNPTRGRLVIETPGAVRLTICDGTGRIVTEQALEEGQHNLDISHYAAGIYLVKFTDPSGTRITKLVKTE